MGFARFLLLSSLTLLFTAISVRNIYLKDTASCEDMMKNHRLEGMILRTKYVYTALQCQDQCFRANTCDGFNLCQNKTKNKQMICELIKFGDDARIVVEKFWAFQMLNRSELKINWVSACKWDTMKSLRC